MVSTGFWNKVSNVTHRCQFYQHFTSFFLYRSGLPSYFLLLVWLCNFLANNIGAKAAYKMLVKLITVVNFINVKGTNFSYERCVLAAFSSYMYIEKRRSYEIFVRKMLMKLTPGWHFTFTSTVSLACVPFSIGGTNMRFLSNSIIIFLGKVTNIEYGKIDFEKVIIKLLTSTRLQYRKR